MKHLSRFISGLMNNYQHTSNRSSSHLWLSWPSFSSDYDHNNVRIIITFFYTANTEHYWNSTSQHVSHLKGIIICHFNCIKCPGQYMAATTWICSFSFKTVLTSAVPRDLIQGWDDKHAPRCGQGPSNSCFNASCSCSLTRSLIKLCLSGWTTVL